MGKPVTDMGNVKKSQELKKHAAAIHCSNTLSLLQRKISNALLYHAYKELLIKEEHEISIKQLCQLIAYQGHNYAAIKDALRGLISTVIEWNLTNDETGTEDWTASSILASVSLQGPLCYYAYSPRMKQLLHSPSMFGKINLVIQSRFKSSYGLALYENCTRYRGLPYTKWANITLFRQLMGIPDGKYDIFRDFKRRVLDKAVEEVNTYSDLVIEPELMREGRRVAKIRFRIKERSKKLRLGVPIIKSQEKIEDKVSNIRLKLVNEYGLSEEQTRQLLSEYELEFLIEKIYVVESSANYQQGKVHNLAGYLISALKHDYQLPRANLDNHTFIKQLKEREETELDELKRQIELIHQEYLVYREAVIDEAIARLAAEEKHVFMERFYQFAAPAIHTVLSLQAGKYSKDTILLSPQIKGLLRQYAYRELDFLELYSLEEFVAQLSTEKQNLWRRLKASQPDHPVLQYSD